MPRPQLAEFMRRMEPDSIAIIPSAREANRSNDTDYRYRQDSDFFYLTGFNEPEAIAVVAPSHPEHKFMLFVRPRDPEREIWDGRRAGVEGAMKEYGAEVAHTFQEFRDKLPELLNGPTNLYYKLGANSALDEMIVRELRNLRANPRTAKHAPDHIIEPGTLLHEMRLIKSDEEIALMQRSADIAAEAHREAMRAARPGMKEYEIEALIEHIFRRHGATAPAYTSIVGAGANATILHYINNDGTLQDGDLLLVDAGAEYQGYASDITRTFPINGRYTQAQREVYELVLKAQESCIEMARPGVTMDELKKHSIEIQTEGMVRLGLLQGDPEKLIEEEKYKQFYMHGLGHYLGLDVHDVGPYYARGTKQGRPLEAGTVITIEPGIYIAPDTKDIPPQYLGIGIRSEDDVLITPEGNRVLTTAAPKQIEEIEQLMAR
ncbi:MAG TPA: Xaa-Pro aminopeptidase [Pyrinomonadaceae bacterium]